MQLARDLILCAALIGLLVVYWIMNKRNLLSSKGARPTGGTSGALRRWLSGRQNAMPQNPIAGMTAENDGSEYETAQALAVLDDMYREFRDEMEAVHGELDDLRASFQKERSEMLSRLSRLEESASKSGSREEVQSSERTSDVSNAFAVDEATPRRWSGGTPDAQAQGVLPSQRSATFDIRYLEVLDRLSEGESLQSIAMDLELDLEDVKMVQRIMSTPPSEVQ